MENSIIDAFIQYGALGAVAIAAIIDVHCLQRRMFALQEKMLSVVENNTRAFAELREIIKSTER